MQVASYARNKISVLEIWNLRVSALSEGHNYQLLSPGAMN